MKNEVTKSFLQSRMVYIKNYGIYNLVDLLQKSKSVDHEYIIHGLAYLIPALRRRTLIPHSGLKYWSRNPYKATWIPAFAGMRYIQTGMRYIQIQCFIIVYILMENIKNITIETERLLLVPTTKAYATEIFNEFNEEVTRDMRFAPSKNIEETENNLQEAIQKMNDGVVKDFIGLDKATKKFI